MCLICGVLCCVVLVCVGCGLFVAVCCGMFCVCVLFRFGAFSSFLFRCVQFRFVLLFVVLSLCDLI